MEDLIFIPDETGDNVRSFDIIDFSDVLKISKYVISLDNIVSDLINEKTLTRVIDEGIQAGQVYFSNVNIDWDLNYE